MKFLRELFGNIPIFQRNVEKELEAKGIKPMEGVKKLEHSRQSLRVTIIVIILVGFLGFAGYSYWKNANQQGEPPKEEKIKTEGTTDTGKSDTPKEEKNADHLIKMSAKERAEEATKAFTDWYTSFENKKTILEVNNEVLKSSEKTSPYELQDMLVKNLKHEFKDFFTEDYEKNLRESLNFNPLTIDPQKGLTISYQDDKQNWLMTWLFDMEKSEHNTKIVLRNDFPAEWADWRNKGQNEEKFGNILKNIDWNNDISYEVIGINMMDSNKNLKGFDSKFILVVMHYNQNSGKWQMTGTIGGVY